MTNADHKVMELLYAKATAATTAIMNEWDPYQLISGGAPKDEFESEASQIVARAHETHAPEELAKVISEVFSAAFGPELFAPDSCLVVATCLFDKLRSIGFLGRQVAQPRGQASFER